MEQEKEELRYFHHFWEHILMKQMLEIEKRYFNRVPLATDLYEELQELWADKVVIPFIDFSVATVCSLKCKYCTQWLPYIKEGKIYTAKEVSKWFENIFRYVDYIHIISPFGGEAFLNPEYAEILEEILEYQKEGKIGYIRIVTNGTIFPSERLQKVLCNPNILILVSDYEHVLTEKQCENYKRFMAFLEKNHCKYYVIKMEWTDLGVPGQKAVLTKEMAREWFETCFIKDCAGIYNGNLYHCARTYLLENRGDAMPKADEVIRFEEVTSKEEMKERLNRFYMLDNLSACAWCKAPNGRKNIPSAEQL